MRVLCSHSLHADNCWERTVLARLKARQNSVRISYEEPPNIDRDTYISDTFPDILLRSR